jgi:large repetitive protein
LSRWKIAIAFLIFLCIVVPTAAVSVSLVDTPNPSYPGQEVTFIATVTDFPPDTTTWVHFYQEDGGGDWDFITSREINITGVAEYKRSFSDRGSYNIKAEIQTGQEEFSYDTVDHYVDKIPTSIAVTSDMNPAYIHSDPTFTATVTPDYPYYGSIGYVQFKKNGVDFGSEKLVYYGEATLSEYEPFDVGSYIITAEYLGNDYLKKSTSPGYNQEVKLIPTTVHLGLYHTDNPSPYGGTIQFYAYATSYNGGAGGQGSWRLYRETTPGVWTTEASHDGGGSTTFTIDDSEHSITRQPGMYTFKAEWSGNDDYDGNISEELEHTVNGQYTSTAVVSSDNPSTLGESVLFTATVTRNGGYPDGGTVQFTIDGSNFGAAVPISSSTGVATSGPTNTLTIGNHIIKAEYSGTDLYANSTGSVGRPVGVWDWAEGQLVNKVPTTTTVDPISPVNFGSPVPLSATVSANPPGGQVPAGTVTFSSGSTTLGQRTLPGSAPYSVSLTISGMAAGTRVITATYTGDANFDGSQGTGSLTVNQIVTTTAVISNKTPTVYGEQVRFTALVTVPQGQPVPIGSVEFKEGITTIGTGTLNSTGGTSLDVSSLSVGSHSINATYSGNTNFTGSWQVVTQTVNKAGTGTTVVSNKTTTVFGEPVRFTALVAVSAPGAGIPTGTVTFTDGLVTIGTTTLNSTGGTSLDVSSLSVGTHSINATYSGNTNFAGSWQIVTQTVNKAGTNTTVVSSRNPAAVGLPVTFTATVSVVTPGAGNPTGTVTFKDGLTTIGTGTLSGNSATFTTSALLLGLHTITASYGGDTSFSTSTSSGIAQKVNPLPVITSFGPATAVHGTTANMAILGNYFQNGMTVKLVQGTTIIPVTVNTLTPPSRIAASVTIPSSARGKWNLVASNTDGGECTRLNAYTIT